MLEPPPVSRRTPTIAIREFIRNRKGFIAHAELYSLATREFGDRADAEQIIEALKAEDVAVTAVAPAVFASEASVDDAASLIFNAYNPLPAEWLEILWPVVKGDDVEDKAKAILAAMETAEGVDWSRGDYGDAQPEEFVRPLVERGLTPLAAIRIIHDTSDVTFGGILSNTDLPQDAAAVADMARELAVDFANDDGEVGSLCEDLDFEYSDIFTVLKAAGMDANNALAAFDRGRSDGSSIDDLADELFPALVKAGYSNLEALLALDDNDWEINRSRLIEIAFGADVSVDEVASFLKEVGADPQEVEDELREEDILDQKDRIELMYRWLHTEPRPEPESEIKPQ